MASLREKDYVLNLARLQFYKKYFSALTMALLVALLVIGVLVSAFVVVKNQRVEREYFAQDSQTGRLTPIVPLGAPYLSDSVLLTWVQQCVTDANTYDFVNYQKQFQQNSRCFTKDGWKQFLAAVERTNTLDIVKNQRLIAQGVAAGAAVITNTGLRRGIYTWRIELPVTVTYQGGQAGRQMFTQRLLIMLTVSRVPTFESKEGVGITQYVATEK